MNAVFEIAFKWGKGQFALFTVLNTAVHSIDACIFLFSLSAGVELRCLDALKALVAQHQVPSRTQAAMHVLSLANPAQLRPYDR